MTVHPVPHARRLWAARLRRLTRLVGVRLTRRAIYASAVFRLRAARHRLRSVDAVCEIDVEGRVRALNPTAMRLLGWEEGTTLANLPVHDVLHPGVRIEEAMCPIHCALEFGEVYHVTDRFQTRTGQGVDVEYLCVPTIGPEGNRVIGAVITFHRIQPIGARGHRQRAASGHTRQALPECVPETSPGAPPARTAQPPDDNPAPRPICLRAP